MKNRCLPTLALVVLLLGCGDGRVKLSTAPVTGTATYQGKPLGAGRIIFFHPSGQAAGVDVAGDGSFALTAFQGRNQIAIECFAPGQPSANVKGRSLAPKSLIPERYTDFSTSGLVFEVKPRANAKADFVLQD